MTTQFLRLDSWPFFFGDTAHVLKTGEKRKVCWCLNPSQKSRFQKDEIHNHSSTEKLRRGWKNAEKQWEMKGARFEDLFVVFSACDGDVLVTAKEYNKEKTEELQTLPVSCMPSKTWHSPSIARDGHCTAYMGSLPNFKSQSFLLRIREATHPALSTKTTMISLYSNKTDSEIPLLSKNLFVAVHVRLGQRRYFFFTQHGLTPALEALTAWCQFYPGGTWKNMKNEIPPLAHRHNEMTKIEDAKIESREQIAWYFHKRRSSKYLY